MYVGGHFATIGGADRRGLAALDIATGLATAWNPNPDKAVGTLAVSGSTVYAGGSFTSIGGASRRGIAALDATTGRATAFNANPQPADSFVDSMAVMGQTVVVGGKFEKIGGAVREFIAGLDAATGRATPWNPPLNMFGAFSLAASTRTLYAGGDFGVYTFAAGP
jgi:hypothetical protein